ncbi:malto-oligosyltrehalose trehalohydrolase [Rosistilla oblonga]|uniref:Malto-oligosyltrehalose trehalohydrolase n=1 Tax=Rosistilla oblonga TaxID=2527990 RepID=A0A518IXQ5_9BACT|nr:malto-oligosyltrehalose trehalohydrolase [Rosistilla oblonga]QDV57875.1 Malto-oligosyltrehalose trehalohydrolase [Rosistilla oblonga]
MPIRPRSILATDLDGTLLPLQDDPTHIADLQTLLENLRANDVQVLPVTGRDRAAMIEALQAFQIPAPEVAICDGGTTIVVRNDDGGFDYLPDFQTHLEANFASFATDDVSYLLRDLVDLRFRATEKQNQFKISYFAEAKTLQATVATIQSRLRDSGIDCDVISGFNLHWGEGLVDILPAGLSKAYALQWWLDRSGNDRDQVVFAGDGGNDLEVFLAGYRTIVVGNAEPEIASTVYAAHRTGNTLDRFYLSEARATSGVLDGCRWFELVPPEKRESRSSDPLGAVPVSCNATHFNIWAPYAGRLAIEKQNGDEIQRFRIQPDEDGYFHRTVRGIGGGDRYQISLDDRVSRPDPASRFQPQGVHGPSMVVDHRKYPWHDADYRGVAKSDLVIYEMHFGTFTSEGSYLAAIDRIEELVSLGITAVEVLPLAQCAGSRNWGYDGVQLYAATENYGTPDDFKRFVDACHAVGIAVILDVVYNHLGPEGNYLHDFGPYFSKRHHTPWGDAFNYDGENSEAARRFVIENAVYWLREYHLDGLRLDAVHFMFDDSDQPILRSIRHAVTDFAGTVDRPIHLIGEANIYDHALVSPTDGTAYDAIWADDIMHAIYSHTVPEINLAHRHYAGATDIEEALQHGYLHTGPKVTRIDSEVRRQMHAEGDFSFLPSLICGLQTHDCVGNHPHGSRFHQLTSTETQRAAIPLLMLYPSIPMIFMGEEYACDAPFMFFVDFGDPRLRRAVDRGRRNEYPHHQWKGAIAPSHDDAFANSKSIQIKDPAIWQWYRDLIALRKTWQRESLLDWKNLSVVCDPARSLFALQYQAPTGRPKFVVSRFSAPADELPPLSLQIDGDVLMQSSVHRDSPTQLTLQNQAVLIGEGTWNLAAGQ